MSPDPIGPEFTPHGTPPTPKPHGPAGAGDKHPQTPRQTSWEDPAGIWANFLGGHGSPASPQEVQMFISTLMRFFSNVIFQQANESAKRASAELRKRLEGKEDD